jgi:hypothetical protein
MMKASAFLLTGVKIAAKLVVVTVVYFVLYLLSSALMPFSAAFKALDSSSVGIGAFLFSSAWACFTVYFAVTHSRWRGIKLFAALSGTLFFVQYVMTQIETLFFVEAFPALTRPDVVFIMFAGLAPTAAAVLLTMAFFRRKTPRKALAAQPPAVEADVGETAGPGSKQPIKSLLGKLAAFGFIYLAVYMIFGYFVVWQFEPARIFYTGSPVKPSFLEQLRINAESSRIIYPLQVLRGILFGAALLPLLFMAKNKRSFILCACFVYLCSAVLLIIPNPLFPDAVRYAHLIETTSSMLLLGIIAGNLLYPAAGEKSKAVRKTQG